MKNESQKFTKEVKKCSSRKSQSGQSAKILQKKTNTITKIATKFVQEQLENIND